MLAIIQCPECQRQVSDKAPLCPHCGVKISNSDGLFDRPKKWLPKNYKEGRKLNKPIGCVTTVVIYIAIVIVAVAGILFNNFSPNLKSTKNEVVSYSNTFEIVPDSIHFERRTNNSTVYISGKIANYTKKKRYIEIEYAIFDKEKNLLFTNRLLSEKSIAPSKAFSFEIEYYDEQVKAASFEILSIIGH